MRSNALRLVRANPEPVSMLITFGADENPISQSGRWICGKTLGSSWQDLKILNNRLYGTQAGNNAGTTGGPYDDATGLIVHPSGKAWPADQDVIGTVGISDTGTAGPTYRELEIRLRSSLVAGICAGYELLWRCTQDGSQYMQIVRWNGARDSFDVLKDAVSPAGILTGYQIRGNITGTLITAYQRANSGLGWTTVTTYDTANDSPRFKSGAPGAGTWIRGNTDASKHWFESLLVTAA